MDAAAGDGNHICSTLTIVPRIEVKGIAVEGNGGNRLRGREEGDRDDDDDDFSFVGNILPLSLSLPLTLSL